MNQELETSLQRALRKSPENILQGTKCITNSCRRISPFLIRQMYNLHFITYNVDDILHHRIAALPYATNTIFFCDMHYYWEAGRLHFHISSSDGVINNEFDTLTKSGRDIEKYLWRVDDITGVEILAEDYIYATLEIVYMKYFFGIYVPYAKWQRTLND